MANLYDFSEIEILSFFLVLIRISCFLVTWPVLGARSVPVPVKILLALSISLMLFPVVEVTPEDAKLFSSQIIWLSFKEAFVGAILGFIAHFLFFAIRIAGETISVSMGLSNSQLFNPNFGGQSTALEQFLLVLTSLLFLAIKGHHMFLVGMTQSFQIFPLTELGVNFLAFSSMGVFAGEIMMMGVKISTPVLVSILFVNSGMAVMGRAVPQINVLITSLPVNVMIGFSVLLISLPLIIVQMNVLTETTLESLFAFMRAF